MLVICVIKEMNQILHADRSSYMVYDPHLAGPESIQAGRRVWGRGSIEVRHTVVDHGTRGWSIDNGSRRRMRARLLHVRAAARSRRRDGRSLRDVNNACRMMET